MALPRCPRPRDCASVLFSEFICRRLSAQLGPPLTETFSVGAPAGGMNTATRTAVQYCLARGHTPLAIYNGFPGLLEGYVEELNLMRVDEWTTRGGSELGTNRKLPDTDIKAVGQAFIDQRLDGLLVIGGFEAFSSIEQLSQARDAHPAFRIPLLHLPATVRARSCRSILRIADGEWRDRSPTTSLCLNGLWVQTPLSMLSSRVRTIFS